MGQSPAPVENQAQGLHSEGPILLISHQQHSRVAHAWLRRGAPAALNLLRAWLGAGLGRLVQLA